MFHTLRTDRDRDFQADFHANFQECMLQKRDPVSTNGNVHAAAARSAKAHCRGVPARAKLGFALLMIAAMETSCGGNKAPSDAAGVSSQDAKDALAGRYVAMGSSFAAGPSIPDAVPDQSCGRSTGNYPHLVAAAIGLELTDVSCVGATIDNITGTPQAMNPVQIDAITPDTRLITITIGGNDVQYSRSLLACGTDGLNGRSCLTSSGEAAAPDVDSGAIDELLNQEADRLVAMLGKVKQTAPAADIYLVAYPMVLPDPPMPCPPDVPLQSADAAFLGGVGARLQTAFSSAAATAGVHFVDVYGASHGHDACATANQRWVEGQANPNVTSYHPNAAGMRAQADLILAQIERNTP